MRKLIGIFFLIVCCCTMTQCDRCLGTGFGECADAFSFRLVNKSTQSDLVFGQNPVYNRDSVFLFTTLTNYPGRVSSADSNKFTSYLSIPADTIFLYLNAADTDTLLIKYRYIKEPCCRMKPGYGKISEIAYNGVVSKKQDGIYLFGK